MAQDTVKLPVNSHPPTLFEIAKRIFDLVISAALILILSLPLLIVAVLVKVTSPGKVFYVQRRVGLNGRYFNVFKFRTMVSDADRSGPLCTAADDDRITPFGRFLRNNKIDEIPQLFNVIRGEMSLVGPRPQVPRFVENFPPDLREVVLSVRPGVTGPTQLHYRDEETLLQDRADREAYYISVLLPRKCRMDYDYVVNRSATSDVAVLLKTAWVVVIGLARRFTKKANRALAALPAEAVVVAVSSHDRDDPASDMPVVR